MFQWACWIIYLRRQLLSAQFQHLLPLSYQIQLKIYVSCTLIVGACNNAFRTNIFPSRSTNDKAIDFEHCGWNRLGGNSRICSYFQNASPGPGTDANSSWTSFERYRRTGIFSVCHLQIWKTGYHSAERSQDSSRSGTLAERSRRKASARQCSRMGVHWYISRGQNSKTTNVFQSGSLGRTQCALRQEFASFR